MNALETGTVPPITLQEARESARVALAAMESIETGKVVTLCMSAPAQKKLRVGILSMAHMHSQSYASALAAHPGVEFVGIADADAERGRAAAIAYSTNISRLPRLCCGKAWTA